LLIFGFQREEYCRSLSSGIPQFTDSENHPEIFGLGECSGTPNYLQKVAGL